MCRGVKSAKRNKSENWFDFAQVQLSVGKGAKSLHDDGTISGLYSGFRAIKVFKFDDLLM